ncbi:MAG TPA: M28 family peptidase [Steroidobacteraceae bacterium]|nr:M28 family peptidase [Steroidobacteraceae bacterium]
MLCAVLAGTAWTTAARAANAPEVRRESTAPPHRALAAIDGRDFLHHIEILSSDGFEGRSPGTHGEAVTVDYLERQFRAIGLRPGSPDGAYTQRVPMTGFTSHPQASIAVGARRIELHFPEDFVAFSPVRRSRVEIPSSQLVFVGYGVIAPEYGWNDYKGLDVRGKTLVMLINDPPVPDPNDPSKLDPKMFGGKAMTYYGRWTYKYEIASKLGAAAAIIVHETGPAAYPYSVVVNSFGHENFTLKGEPPSESYPTVAGWITHERAQELFAACGLDFEQMKKAAVSREFRPVPLKARMHFTIDNTWEDIESHNVVGRVEGSDPKLRSQYVIYTAHWDHFGWDPKLPGGKHEQIYHGARDNASGVAALLELARAYEALPRSPKRSILFIATTGEERGLLGARYYARHPLYPLRDTAADINMDVMPTWGRTRDVELISAGKSNIDDTVRAEAHALGMVVEPDLHPERGTVYRADQLEFARVGVPVVYLHDGLQVIGKPAGFGEHQEDDYIAHHYHQVTDVIDPRWDLSGAVQQIDLLFRIGYSIAQTAAYPQWNPDAEFRAVREKTMQTPAP